MPASVRLYGLPAGILDTGRDGRLSMRYLPEWITAHADGIPHAHAVSASMPVQDGIYEEDKAGPFFDGLLPDSKNIRETLARYFEVDASDDYGLLTALGRECPGAVSIVPLDETVIPEDRVLPEYDTLDERRLARHIRDLPRRPLFIDADGELRLSLPGVHHKTAVLRVGNDIALPRGRTPTSHILKVDIQGLPDSIRVEHFCLRMAAAVGLDVPHSSIRRAEDQIYMLIARYDRTLVDAGGKRYLRRVHQEDFCQALGRYPREKYEKDGGPGWRDCFQLMDLTSDPATARRELLGRAVFQFLIGNPDAHAKNYSLVCRGRRMSLSKLYDVNNAAAFRKHYKEQRPRLAMFVGSERDPERLTPDDWAAFSEDAGIQRSVVMERLHAMAAELPGKAAGLREDAAGTEADSPLLDLVLDDIGERCSRVLGWGQAPVRGRRRRRDGP